MQGDNAAIAIRDLAAGARFRLEGAVHTLSHAVLEGHRFAVASIRAGEYLLSWTLPFGRALRGIKTGEYLCNASVLDALRLRRPELALPRTANFQNAAAEFKLDEASYQAGEQLALHPNPGTFMGFPRDGGRGIGTRNVIVLLGTTSGTASFVRHLEAELKSDAGAYPNIDGILAVAHTEGSGEHEPNNAEFVLRTLAGFIVHPNVAAVLAVDLGSESITNALLQRYMAGHGYPLEHVPHRFHSLRQDLATSLSECAGIVRQWYAGANAVRREACPLSGLKVALQCGGSDAFSGVSGNPLAGWVAREVIRHGGAAGLAETDELIGAEPYMLVNTRDLATARRFLKKIAVFRERISWHGHSAEGNPTGGNLFRGLYNISLKSIGAARKKDPDLRLDHVIDYAERMVEPGFYFMDSPGNDLESIAGQVASGCNLIFFITGNGSITNFPFVPTVKFVTTTRRWNLLSRDMDVNAGRYLDGEDMEMLGRETFRHALATAGGQRSVGELAGHSQVSIWRDWCQTDGSQLEKLLALGPPGGEPISIRPATKIVSSPLGKDSARHFSGTVGLILPTSLCAGQIALKIAAELNARRPAGGGRINRFVALPHTEGCGASSGENEAHYLRTVVGHLLHPMVGAAVLLEHGCEHTHNDLMRHTLKQQGIDIHRFGYASIQLDGGIDQVMARVIHWFETRPEPQPTKAPKLTVALTSAGAIGAVAAGAMARLAAALVEAGGGVVVPQKASMLAAPAFLRELGLDSAPAVTLDYGQVARVPGFYVMATPTVHFVEGLTGLGGTGASVILAHVCGAPMQGHPMIPTLQVSTAGPPGVAYAADFDLLIDAQASDADRICAAMLRRITDTLSGAYAPHAWSGGFTDFQLTRGLLGVSL